MKRSRSEPSFGLMKRSRSDHFEDGEAEASSPAPSLLLPSVREDGFQYDVFLSFSGADTRKGFTGHLYYALKDKGINAFIDSENLEKGEKIEELLQCIERSRIFVPIFSESYAQSKWCLREIAKIVDCKRLIIPIFFKVEPTDVRNQSGHFAPAFTGYHKDENIGEAEVSKWSAALKEAGNVSGYTLADTNGDESRLVRLIVERISTETNKVSWFVAKYPVGLESRIADVKKCLAIKVLDDVIMVGIHAMGGMGKTTLATAVYNQISSCFDACSFISHVRKNAESKGLTTLQQQLLSDVFNENNVKINNIHEGIGKIQARIRSKKVLLVLDDIDRDSQLHALAGSLDWFCKGSRIMITTRDKDVLRGERVNWYELKKLDAIQSLQLFNWHAFRTEEPKVEFAKLSKEVASVASGHPLALELFGSMFRGMETHKEWETKLEMLKAAQDRGIYETLRLSYDALDEKEKKVFLDIVFFFIDEERKLATLMWEGCGFYPSITVKALIHKCLVSINEKTQKFEMHDLIRDMGRQIVADESRSSGGNWSRLNKKDEILNILQNKRGTKNIEAITMKLNTYFQGRLHISHTLGILFDPRRDVPGSMDFDPVDTEAFAEISQLRILKLGHRTLEGEYRHIPRSLAWLQWSPQNLDFLPPALHLENIVILDLSYSSITQVWNPQSSTGTKVFAKLKVLKLRACFRLTKCPDFTIMPYLEKLDLSMCDKIDELHPSIGRLKNLTDLSLENCYSLETLPHPIWQLSSLQKLDLTYCCRITIIMPSRFGDWRSLKNPLLNNLKELRLAGCRSLATSPDFMTMPHLETLDFSYCLKLSQLCSSIKKLRSLTHLSLYGCKSLRELPKEVWQLTSLKELDLSYCCRITTFPSPFEGCLNEMNVLNLTGCTNLRMSPEFTGMPHLRRLIFVDCKKMSKLHASIGHVKTLIELDLYNCKSLKELPEQVCELTSLEILRLSCCDSITSLPSDLGDLKSLKKLFLYRTGIITLPLSMRQLKQLKHLNLEECSRMMEIPECVWSLFNLEKLEVAKCKRLACLPDSLGNLRSLKKLDLSFTAIQDLPDSIVSLEKLKVLAVIGCKRLKFLPASASIESTMLKDNVLSASDGGEPSKRQPFLPQFPPSLIKLKARGCHELEMIADVSNAKTLRKLSLGGCRKLVEIPGIEQLEGLNSLKLGGCKSLSHSLRKRIQETNFGSLTKFTIPGSLSIVESSDHARSLLFFLPKRLKIRGHLVLQLEERGVEHVGVQLDITRDDGQELLGRHPFKVKVWKRDDYFDESQVTEVNIPVECVEVMMVRVSVSGRLLLDGYIWVDIDDVDQMGYDQDDGANKWLQGSADSPSTICLDLNSDDDHDRACSDSDIDALADTNGDRDDMDFNPHVDLDSCDNYDDVDPDPEGNDDWDVGSDEDEASIGMRNMMMINALQQDEDREPIVDNSDNSYPGHIAASFGIPYRPVALLDLYFGVPRNKHEGL